MYAHMHVQILMYVSVVPTCVCVCMSICAELHRLGYPLSCSIVPCLFLWMGGEITKPGSHNTPLVPPLCPSTGIAGRQ